MKKADTKVVCDICKKEFDLNKNSLREEHVTLQTDEPGGHPVVLTILQCPRCGKSYTVMLDDDTTLPLLEKLRTVMVKQAKRVKSGFGESAELAEKQRRLNWKLNFKRQKLAEKYYGSLYQLGDSLEQLDYRYRTR